MSCQCLNNSRPLLVCLCPNRASQAVARRLDSRGQAQSPGRCPRMLATAPCKARHRQQAAPPRRNTAARGAGAFRPLATRGVRGRAGQRRLTRSTCPSGRIRVVPCSAAVVRRAVQGPARPRATGPRVRCGCSRRGKKKSLARRLGTVPVPRDPPAIRVTERRGGSGWDTNNILYASTKHGDGGW